MLPLRGRVLSAEHHLPVALVNDHANAAIMGLEICNAALGLNNAGEHGAEV